MGPVGAPPLALPRVAVIVTCFNYGRFIADALESVAAQTYPNCECIVVDDASTDNSVAVIEQWLATAGDARFRLIRSDTNRGQLASIASGLAASDSEFVALLDADDFWFPEFLQRHVEAHLNRFGAASFSCSDLIHVDAARRVLAGGFNGRRLYETRRKNPLVPIPNAAIPQIDSNPLRWDTPGRTRIGFLKSDILRWHWTATSALMFRRAMLNLALPKQPEDVKIPADVYLATICHYFTGSVILSDALGAYRRHGGNWFSYLPVLGSGSFNPPHHSEKSLWRVYQTILGHLLDHQDALIATFGKPVVRRAVRTLFRFLLAQGEPLNDPRIRSIIGNSRYYRDRLRGFLQRP